MKRRDDSVDTAELNEEEYEQYPNPSGLTQADYLAMNKKGTDLAHQIR